VFTKEKSFFFHLLPLPSNSYAFNLDEKIIRIVDWYNKSDGIQISSLLNCSLFDYSIEDVVSGKD
jgi:hypothetical protein